MRLLFCFVFLTYALMVFSQAPADSIERTLEQQDGDVDQILDFTLLRNRKINLNRCKISDLLNLGYLTIKEANAIIQYRDSFGPFIDLLELQQCDISLTKMSLLKKDCSVRENWIPINSNRSHHVVYFKTSMQLEKSRAYLGDSSIYVGSPVYLGLRYRGQLSKQLDVGLNMEKDAGEHYLTHNRPEFLRGYISIRNVNYIQHAIVGHYTLNFGEGLCFGSGFSAGKSALVMHTKNTARQVRPNTSMNEQIGFRGIYLQPRKSFSFYAGRQQLDASLADGVVSSIRTTGLHRTSSELRGKDILNEDIVGVILNGTYNAIQLGINASHVRYNYPIYTSHVNGNHFTYAALCYNFPALRGNWFGEIVLQDNQATASIHGVHFALHRNLQLALLYRRFSPFFYNRHSRAFSSSAIISNEEGFYSGLLYHPSKKWKIACYVDRSRSITAKNGKPLVYHYDWLMELHYQKNKTLSAYGRMRFRKSSQKSSTIGKHAGPSDRTTWNYRLQLDWTLDDQLTVRSRIECTQTQRNIGLLAYQDLRFKKRNHKLGITSRLALVSVKSYDNRIYAYEHNLAMSFSIPAYQHTGLRHYVIISTPIVHRIHFSMRFAQDLRMDKTSFGSGYDEVSKPRRSTISAQVRYDI